MTEKMPRTVQQRHLADKAERKLIFTAKLLVYGLPFCTGNQFLICNILKLVLSCYLCWRNSYVKTAYEKQNSIHSPAFMDLTILTR